MSSSTESAYPGQGLGLPASGPRSLARFGRRLAALLIDWLLSVLLSMVFASGDALITLAIFAVSQIVLVLLLGASVGHFALRMRLVPITGGALAWWRPIVRTALLCLVLPALISDQDQRGLHDKLAGTMLVVV